METVQEIEGIQIRLDRDRMESLYTGCEQMLDMYEPANNHEQLLRAHLVAMYWLLGDKLGGKGRKILGKRKQETFNIKISARDAMAFLLLWGNETLDMYKPETQVILEIIALLNKEEVTNKRIYGKDNN